MQRDKVLSIITIVCFCSIVLIPLGLALMWFMTAWKKKRKIIITCAGSVLYIAIVAFILLLEPSYNTGGVSLPFKYSGGETAYDAPANPGRPSKKEKKISPASDKKQKSEKSSEEPDEERVPRSVKRQSGRSLGRAFYVFLFFQGTDGYLIDFKHFSSCFVLDSFLFLCYDFFYAAAFAGVRL